MKKIEAIDDVEAFLLKHGENIVDMLGGEIDRIELKLRVRTKTMGILIFVKFSFLTSRLSDLTKTIKYRKCTVKF